MIPEGCKVYSILSKHEYEAKVIGTVSAHLVPNWIHEVSSNLSRWVLGTFHGLCRAHVHRYPEEFMFRWNRRCHTATAFDTLLGIEVCLKPAGYRHIAEHRP